MTNIHDIAKKSGYSAATVSRVLNNRKHVSTKARTVIEAVIREMDYAPNEIARDLSSGKSGRIGVILPHVAHPFFSQLLNGIISSAFSTPHQIVVLPSEYDRDRELEYLEQLKRRAFDGIIFTSHGISLSELSRFVKYGPIVCCEDPGKAQVPAVYARRDMGYREAFFWLKAQGVLRPAFLFSRPYEKSATTRLTLDTYREIFGQMPPEHRVASQITTYEDGYRQTDNWLKSQAGRPDYDAVFSNGDTVAAGVLAAYQKWQLPPPLIIGQENELAGQLLGIPTIDHHLDKIGALAFRSVSENKPGAQVSLDSRFVLR